MKGLNGKTIAKKNHSEANSLPKLQSSGESTFLDNYTSKATRLRGYLEEETLQGKFEPIQEKANNTGLPDNLKSGIENLSGYSMDNVKVNYNSDKPAQLNAHASPSLELSPTTIALICASIPAPQHSECTRVQHSFPATSCYLTQDTLTI